MAARAPAECRLRGLPLLFLLLLAPVCVAAQVPDAAGAGQVQTVATAGLDVPLLAEVLGAAYAFMVPRTLDPVTLPELAGWGLHGLAALDPALGATLDGGQVRLGVGARVLLARPAPAADDAASWGQLVADMVQAAAAASPAVRASDTTTVLRAILDEGFAHLDPYSRYVPPHRAQAERDRLSAAVGPGLQLARTPSGIVISAVSPGSPAALLDVRPGDRVLQVDGRDTAEADIATIAGWISGPEGSQVRLLLAGRGARPRSVTLVRAQLPPPAVLVARSGELLVLRIGTFTTDTAEALSGALEDGLAARRRPGGVVLDLRGNRGGLLRQAVTCVALLIDSGLVATTQGRDPQASHAWRVQGGDLAQGLPVVVLVDGRTASAAEVLAAALADGHRAVVVGSATLGKGLVQTITPLPDGGELFVTWSRILAPLGWPLQGLGVVPQLCTSLGEAAAQRQLHALAAGEQEMQAALVASRQARAPLDPARVLALRAACPAMEGSDADLDAARFLVAHPAAYAAALLAVPPS